jgi:hypothetical protein
MEIINQVTQWNAAHMSSLDRLISLIVLSFSFESILCRYIETKKLLHQRWAKVQYLVEPQWQQHSKICSSGRCSIQKNNITKTIGGTQPDESIYYWKTSEVSSPSTTPRIEKSIEEYDITAKFLQN